MNSDGTFTEVTLFGETVSGKSLMDKAEQLARDGYFAKNGSEEKRIRQRFSVVFMVRLLLPCLRQK